MGRRRIRNVTFRLQPHCQHCCHISASLHKKVRRPMGQLLTLELPYVALLDLWKKIHCHNMKNVIKFLPFQK